VFERIIQSSGGGEMNGAQDPPKAVLNTLGDIDVLDLFPPPSITFALPIVLIAHPDDTRMTIKIDIGLLIDGLELLVPVAKAVPVLGAPVEGALEAVKKILNYAEVSTSDQQAESARHITAVQQVKNNKDETLALAKYIGEITPKLFLALQSLDDVDSIKSSIDDFVRYVPRPGASVILMGHF
jgi:hypothetical protein